MKTPAEIGMIVPAQIAAYSALLTALTTALGPALAKAKAELLALFGQLKADNLLDDAAEAELLARIAVIDKAIEGA